MTDQFGRKIEYMRVSLTDRCNLRCRYCMPNGIELANHGEMLTIEETLRICKAAVALGITKFKVTGGEPLVRRGCLDFMRGLKAMSGVEQVTLTTNGLLLSGMLDALTDMGIDGVNISIDTLDSEKYLELTGMDNAGVSTALQALNECVERGIKTKVNAVLLEDTFEGIVELAGLAAEKEVDVRFIELMPIGEGAFQRGVSMEAALERLRRSFPDLHPVEEHRGNGPARYFASGFLKGRIGFIDAVSHGFCSDCNRVRLTALGILKPCLCFEEGASLRELLRGGCTDGQLNDSMRSCIKRKPRSHSFLQREGITEHKTMNQIGG